MAHPRSWRRRSRRTRGATVVEYALGASFVLVATMGAISTLEDRSGEALEERGGSIGAPDLDIAATSSTATTLSSDGGSGTTATTAAPTPPDSTVAAASGTASANGKKWTATIVISITDDGDPVHKAKVQGTWTEQPSYQATSVSCETQPNGTCTFALRDLPTLGNSGHVTSVTFEVTAVTPEGGATNDPDLSVTVNEP